MMIISTIFNDHFSLVCLAYSLELVLDTLMILMMTEGLKVILFSFFYLEIPYKPLQYKEVNRFDR